jgi:O-antigen/teichoic acid export membrane protein
MKTATFFKGLSWLIILNLLVKPVWIFFIDRQVQNIVGHEEYGRYFAVLNLSYVLFFLADAGLSNMLNQRIANGARLNLQQLLRIKYLLLSIYFIVCCFVGWLTQITQWSMLLHILVIQMLISLFVFQRSIVTANQFFNVDAWFSVLDKFLMTVICGSIIYTSFFGNINLLLFLQIQIACSLLAVITAFVFITNKKLLVVAGKEKMERIIKLILPFAIIILLMSVHYRLDGFLLERINYNGALEAGIYASAYRLLDAGNMIGYLAASFLVPFIARHKADKQIIETTAINTRHGLLFLAIGVVTFTVMFAPWIQQLLYHSSDHYNSTVMQLCIAAMPGYFLVQVYGSILTATARFNKFIAILIVSVAMNIVLNLVLIPSYGALGCCIAALASQYVCGITCLIVTTRTFNMSVHYQSIFIYLLTAGLLTGLFYFAKSAEINIWFTVIFAVLITLLLLATQLKKKYFISFRQN